MSIVVYLQVSFHCSEINVYKVSQDQIKAEMVINIHGVLQFAEFL